MDFEGSETYPTDLATTWEYLTRSEVAVERYEAAGHTEVEVLDWGPDGDDFLMRTTRVVHLDLPGFAKKVLKPANTMVQTERWGPEIEGGRDGSFEVEVQGAPVQIRGTTRLRPAAGGGTTHHVSGTLDVKVPLVGGKIADWSGGDARRELEAELAFNLARLVP